METHNNCWEYMILYFLITFNDLSDEVVGIWCLSCQGWSTKLDILSVVSSSVVTRLDLRKNSNLETIKILGIDCVFISWSNSKVKINPVVTWLLNSVTVIYLEFVNTSRFCRNANKIL